MSTASTPSSVAIALRSIVVGARVLRAGERRAHDQRLQPGQRAHHGVGQAERQEVEIGVRPQHPERQRDETRRRAHRRSAVRCSTSVTADRSACAIAFGRWVAVVGTLLERAVNHDIDGGRDRRSGQRRRLTRHDAVIHLHQIVAGERRRAGQHLEEQRAGREEIAARIGRRVSPLLGRHVARRADDRAGLRDGQVALPDRRAAIAPDRSRAA